MRTEKNCHHRDICLHMWSKYSMLILVCFLCSPEAGFSQNKPLTVAKTDCVIQDCQEDEEWWFTLAPEWQNFFCDIYLKARPAGKLGCTELRLFLGTIKQLENIPQTNNLQVLAVCKNLETLNLAANVRERRFHSLKGIEKLKGLKTLYMGSVKVDSFGTELAQLNHLRLLYLGRITDSRIEYNQLPKKLDKLILGPIKDISFLPALKSLKQLILSGIDYSLQDTFDLSVASELKGLRILGIYHCHIVTNKGVQFPNLKELYIGNVNRWGVFGYTTDIDFIQGSKKLEKLILFNIDLSLSEDFFGEFKSLKHLEVANVRHLSHSYSLLYILSYIKKLKHLVLDSDIIRSLEDVPNFRKLRSLKVSGSELQSLEGIDKFKRLKTFECSSSWELSNVKALLHSDLMKKGLKACVSGHKIPETDLDSLRMFPNFCPKKK